MTRPNLQAVPGFADKPLDMGTDIYAKDRAKIASIDWAKVHIRSDRSRPVSIMSPVKRLVMGSGIRLERGGFRPETRP